MDMGEERVCDLEEAILELRLAERAFYQDVVEKVRAAHRRALWRMTIGFTGIVLVWLAVACPVLHQVKLCPWMS